MKRATSTISGLFSWIGSFLLGIGLVSAPLQSAKGVQAAPIDDTTPPSLVSITFDPTTVDVTSEPATVDFKVHVTDDISGVDLSSWSQSESYIYLYGPNNQSYQYVSLQYLKCIAGQPGGLDTTWEGTFTLPQFSAAGVWTIGSIAIYDKAGNQLDLWGSVLDSYALPTLTVTSTADTTPPQLLSFSMSVDPSGTPTTLQPAIDTSLSSQTVYLTLHVTDDLSGVGTAYGNWIENYYGNWENISIYANPPSGLSCYTINAGLSGSGTPLDAVWQGSFTFPLYCPAGTWNVYVTLRDNAGNTTNFDSFALTVLGSPLPLFTDNDIVDVPGFASALWNSQFNYDCVSSWVYAQLRPPTLDALSQYVTALNNTGQADPTLQANLLPLLLADLNSILTSQQEVIYQNNCFWDNANQDTVVNYILNYLQAQGYTLVLLNRLTLQDSFPQLAPIAPIDPSQGAAVTVTSSPSDTTPPVVNSVSIAPITIDTSLSDQTVTVSWDVQDDLSGFNWSDVYLTSPSGGQSHYTYAGQAYNSTQDPANPLLWHCQNTILFPRYSESGTWKFEYVFASDQAGNYAWTYPSASLNAVLNVIKPSLQGDGDVYPSGGTVTDTSAFGDRASITLPPGAVTQDTTVAIDVLSSPLDLPNPTGVAGPGTYYVNINLTPAPTYPVPAPGMTIVLPLVQPLPAGAVMFLYYVDSTGNLALSLDANGNPIQGAIDNSALTATFTGVVHLCTVAGMLSAPSITWNPPADITYGTLLSAAQLNASANISGSFTYDPPLGTLLGAGQAQTLTATFTPDDKTDYPGTYSAKVTLNVNQASLTITADDKTMVAGSALPSFTASFSGFVNKETSVVLTSQPQFSVQGDTTKAGSCSILVSGAAAANYSISYKAGTLTVTAPKTAALLPVSYPLASSKRITATIWEYTYHFTIKNTGNGDATGVMAQLVVPSQVTIVSGMPVNLGTVPAGQQVTSAGTFTLRLDRSKPTPSGSVTWTLGYTDPSGKVTVNNVPYIN